MTRTVRIAAVVAAVAAAGACGSDLASRRGLELRERIARGDAGGGVRALLDLAAAAETPTWLARYGVLEALRLADAWSPDRGDLARVEKVMARRDRAGLLAAELLETLALRSGEDPAAPDGLAAAARRRAGFLEAAERSGRIAPFPRLAFRSGAPALGSGKGLAETDSGRSTWGESPLERVETAGGTIAFPEDGPGLYAARIPLPASASPVEVLVAGDAALRVRQDGREIAASDRLSGFGPRRLEVRVLPGPDRALDLEVASLADAPAVRVAVRPAPPESDPPPDDSLLGLLARLEEALFAADLPAAAAAAAKASIDRSGLAADALARFEDEDPTRPAAVTRARARGLLEDALARDPGLAEVRARLVRILLQAGDAARAEALLLASPGAVDAGATALLVARDRGRGPLAEEDALRLVRERPASCEAWRLLLDLAPDRLRRRPAETPLPPLGCPEERIHAAELLREAPDPDRARAALLPLLGIAPPGSARARVRDALAAAAWRKGDTAEVRSQAEAGLAEAVHRERFLAWLERTARLEGDDAGADAYASRIVALPSASPEARWPHLDPARDLGLPLADGAALVREALSRPEEDVPDAPVELVLDGQHTRVLADGSQVHRVHRLFRIADGAAAETWGEVPLPEGAEVLVARTWKSGDDGALVALEPEDPFDTGALHLAGLEAGAFGEVAWTILAPGSLAGTGLWIGPRFTFEDHGASVRRGSFSVRTDPDAPAAAVTSGDAPEPSEPEPGLRVFASDRPRPRVVEEPLDPRPELRLAAVQVVRAPPLVHATLWSERLLGLVRPAPILRDVAAAALRGAGDEPRERLRALYEHVLDQVQAGPGGPFAEPASFVAASRSGERSVLLTALARAAGIPCDLALARPLARDEPDPFAPWSGDDWSHPLVRARVDGADLWLDPGSRYMPFGYVPPHVQGAPALVLDGAREPTVVTTPRMPELEGLREASIRITVALDGTFVATGVERFTGFYALSWRHALAEMLPEVRQRALAGVVRQSLPGADVEEVALDGLLERGTPLRFRWRAGGRLAPSSRGSALTLGLSPEGLSRATVVLPSRRTPLFQDRSEHVAFTVRLVLPEGWRFDRAPGPARVDHPHVSSERRTTVEDEGRVLTVEKRLRLAPALVGPEGYAAWAEAARAVDAADVLHLEVVPGPAAK